MGNFIFGLSWDGDHCALCYDDIYCMVGGARVSLSGKLTFNVHITFYVPVKINVADGTFTVFFIVLHGEQ